MHLAPKTPPFESLLHKKFLDRLSLLAVQCLMKFAAQPRLTPPDTSSLSRPATSADPSFACFTGSLFCRLSAVGSALSFPPHGSRKRGPRFTSSWPTHESPQPLFPHAVTAKTLYTPGGRGKRLNRCGFSCRATAQDVSSLSRHSPLSTRPLGGPPPPRPPPPHPPPKKQRGNNQQGGCAQ